MGGGRRLLYISLAKTTPGRWNFSWTPRDRASQPCKSLLEENFFLEGPQEQSPGSLAWLGLFWEKREDQYGWIIHEKQGNVCSGVKRRAGLESTVKCLYVYVLSHSVATDSLRLYRPYVACQAPLAWNSPGKNTGVGCHALLQGIFLTQGSNPHLLYLLHCMWILNSWAITETHNVCILFQTQTRDNGGFLNKATLWSPASMDSFLHLYVTLPTRSNPKRIKCLCVGKPKCKFKG